MFPIRHSLFIPPTRAWHIRQVGVDWPARRHYYLLGTHAGARSCLPSQDLYSYSPARFASPLHRRRTAHQLRRPRWPRSALRSRPKFFLRASSAIRAQGARKETASLSRPISRNAWRAAAKSRTTAPTTKKADVLSGPTGSGGGARPPRRRRGRCLAFHKVAKEARQLGPILKRRVRGILHTLLWRFAAALVWPAGTISRSLEPRVSLHERFDLFLGDDNRALAITEPLQKD